MVAARSQPEQTFECVEGEADERRGEDDEDHEEMEKGAGRRSETREGAGGATEAEIEVEAEADADADAEAKRERGEVGAKEGAHRMRGEEEGGRVQKIKNKDEIESENEIRGEDEEDHKLDEPV
jgi:hypothetical protein